jgi:beta-mannosidase
VTYFRLPKDLPLSNPGLRTSLVPSKRGYWIQVSARSLARSVMLACGDDPGFFSDNHFDVLPGGRKVLEYRTSLPITKVKRQLRVRSLVDSYQ